jgi:hypothetical protein
VLCLVEENIADIFDIPQEGVNMEEPRVLSYDSGEKDSCFKQTYMLTIIGAVV